MWLIRRLKSLGCPIPELVEVLKQQIVSICEFGAAYWGCMITKAESNMLERCLKTGLHIIFQEQYTSFTHCLQLANMSSLKTRRIAIITRFSKSALKNRKYKNWFCKSEEPTEGARTRQAGTRPLLKPVQCRTQRFERSPLPVMTRLLSWHPPLPYTPPHLAWNCPDSNPNASYANYLCYSTYRHPLLLIFVCGYFVLTDCCYSVTRVPGSHHLQLQILKYTDK